MCCDVRRENRWEGEGGRGEGEGGRGNGGRGRGKKEGEGGEGTPKVQGTPLPPIARVQGSGLRAQGPEQGPKRPLSCLENQLSICPSISPSCKNVYLSGIEPSSKAQTRAAEPPRDR
jgi:hypothetical protein